MLPCLLLYRLLGPLLLLLRLLRLLLRLHLLRILLCLHTSLLHALHLSCLTFSLTSCLRWSLALLRLLALLGRGITCRSIPPTQLCHDPPTGTYDLCLSLIT